MNDTNPKNQTPGFLWPGIITGLASTVLVWMVWYLLHLPGLRAPMLLSGPLIGLALLGSVGCMARRSSSTVRTGLVAGLTAGIVGLLLLGSKIVRPAGEGTELNPDAPWIVLTFLVACAGLGALGGSLIPKLMPAREPMSTGLWLRWLAGVVAASYFPLLTIGGFVTSSGSGMAVPDWPGTYGSNMFLYPFALMDDPRIFFEHTHRLFGTLAGVCTIALVVGSFLLRGSTTVRALAGVLLVGVIVQGVMGGLRVKESNEWLGALHGVLGQIVLALAVMVVGFAGPALKSDAKTAKLSKAVIMLSLISLGSLVIQVVFGAMYRHLGSSHALWSHLGFSLIVTGAVAHVGIFALRHTKQTEAGRALRTLGMTVMVIVCVQFGLGFAAWGFGSGHGEDRPIPTAQELEQAPPIRYTRSIIATVHQANGAAVAGAVALALALGVRARTGIPADELNDEPTDRPTPEPNAFEAL